MRFVSLCFLIGSLLNTDAVVANVLGDAWQCAKGSAQAGYELAGKGAKALEVLGSAPHCVAYATAGDVPLYATTGALFALNTIDSSIVSANNCVASVKNNAVVPIGKLFNGTFPGVIPPSYLAAGSQEAVDQLWNFMDETPPISEAIDRVDCGCTFLEAGISVQNLVEIFTIIAQAGESCDAALANIPGYQTVKAGVKAGASAMNNLGEDLFTDQVQHKDVDAYYLIDFDGGVDSYAAQSHAAARILNPGHNWRDAEGASFVSQTDVKLSGGANSGATKKATCKNYFDSHKMSASNAEEVCEAMVNRFENDYLSLIPMMKARDALVKSVTLTLAKQSTQAVARCSQSFPPNGATVVKNSYGSGIFYDGFGDHYPQVAAFNHCANSGLSIGNFEWQNPYAAVGSLGTPISTDIVDGWLAGSKKYYFSAPLNATGAAKIAYQVLENNGGNVSAAVSQGVIAFQIASDQRLSEAWVLKEKLTTALVADKAAKLKAATGFAFSSCPTGANYQACLDALSDAVNTCMIAAGSVHIAKEFPSVEEQAKISSIEKKCASAYVGLAIALKDRSSQKKTIESSLSAQCPSAASGAGLRNNCLLDVQQALVSCQGGIPAMTPGYFDTGKFAQDPVPDMSCAASSAIFSKKWGADENWIASVNSAYSSAAIACNNKTPDPVACQQQVGIKSKSCIADIQNAANVLLGSLPLQSPELGMAQGKLGLVAKSCITQMAGIPEKLGAGKAAEVLMLKQYGPRCGRNEECKNALRAAFAQCQGVALPSAGAGSVGVGQPNNMSLKPGALGSLNGVSLAANSRASASSAARLSNNPGVMKYVGADLNVGAITSNGNLKMARVSTKAIAANSGVDAANAVANCAPALEAVLAKFNLSNVPAVTSAPTGSLVVPKLAPSVNAVKINNGVPTTNARDSRSSSTTTLTPAVTLRTTALMPRGDLDALAQRRKPVLVQPWLPRCNNETCRSEVERLINQRLFEEMQARKRLAPNDQSGIDELYRKMDVTYRPLLNAVVSKR